MSSVAGFPDRLDRFNKERSRGRVFFPKLASSSEIRLFRSTALWRNVSACSVFLAAEPLGGQPIGEGSGSALVGTRHLWSRQHPLRHRGTHGNRQGMEPVQAWFLIVRSNIRLDAQKGDSPERVPCTTTPLGEAWAYRPVEECHSETAHSREDKPAFETQRIRARGRADPACSTDMMRV